MKKIISIIIAAIVLISSTLIINAKTSFSEKIFQEIGMSEKENKKNTDTFAKGENITIYNNQIKAIVDLSKLTSQNISEDEAFNIVAKRAVLLNKAEKSGYTVTFEEVENQISKERTMAEQASNYNDFLEYLKGAKQTVDEYWESQKTRAQGELIVEKYLKKEYETFKNSNAKLSIQEMDSKWNIYYAQLCEKLIKDEKFIKNK